jgi:hypothetical protein
LRSGEARLDQTGWRKTSTVWERFVTVVHAFLLLATLAAPPVGTPLLAPAPIVPAVGTPLLAPASIDVPRAQPGPAVVPPSTDKPAALAVAVAEASEPEARHPWIGAQVDVGLPQGIGASVVFRPWYFLQLHLGAVTNTTSGGLTGGLTVVPFRYVIVPTIGFEAGHLFDGNLTGIVSAALGKPSLPEGLLDRLSYDFYTGHLGVEIGAFDRVVFYLRAGISRVNAKLHSSSPQTSGSSSLDPGDVHVNLTIPCAKLGILVYF